MNDLARLLMSMSISTRHTASSGMARQLSILLLGETLCALGQPSLSTSMTLQHRMIQADLKSSGLT
ncbi:TPA: hypothetical protein L6A24_29210 [Pseudomonas aeruginosa]|nr:hypothetical protein B7W86_13680 [Pseudomonas aeruginosa]ARI97686.1 hypothetical protein B7W87_13685 [Pseudomonas aeruginosa]AXS96121.1 hypothetical protein D0Y57_24695 [Pseudomonas aeruginosa]AXT02850.1 hypothetical protein D0Y55_26015 [Pseudomonas aeruginosa]AXT09193.1 hypothetical protein D0Y58_25370 [Pseudomonas aeruginosa]